MRRRFQIGAGVCFAVAFGAVASAGLYSVIAAAPHEQEALDLGFDRELLQAIDITDGGVSVRLERTDGHWRLKDPARLPADEQKIEALLAAWGDQRWSGTLVPPQSAVWEDEQLHGLGLRKTRVEFLSQDGRMVGLELGDTLPSGERYLRMGGCRTVWLADLPVLALLDPRPELWLAADLFVFAPDELVTLDIVTGRGEARVEWSAAGPVYSAGAPDLGHGLSEDEMRQLRFDTLRPSLHPGLLRVHVQTERRGAFELRAGEATPDGRRIVQVDNGEPALVLGHDLDIYERLVL